MSNLRLPASPDWPTGGLGRGAPGVSTLIFATGLLLNEASRVINQPPLRPIWVRPLSEEEFAAAKLRTDVVVTRDKQGQPVMFLHDGDDREPTLKLVEDIEPKQPVRIFDRDSISAITHALDRCDWDGC